MKLRFWILCSNAWGFESLLSHHVLIPSFKMNPRISRKIFELRFRHIVNISYKWLLFFVKKKSAFELGQRPKDRIIVTHKIHLMVWFFWYGFQNRLEPDHGVESWNSLLRRIFNFGIEGEGILKKAGGGVEKGIGIFGKESW